ncbi:MAG TPA: hypothetical protein VJP77_05485 [Planctomycetota bacterium]|nr:hypothetical protein [Planctomycetota bacterium]
MKLRVPLILLLALAATLLLAAIEGRRLDDARRGFEAALTERDRVQADAATLERLRAERPTREVAESASQDLIARVRAALVQAGIPTDRLAELSPEPAVAVGAPGEPGGAALQRQSVRVHLSQVAPRDVGRLLAAWTAEQPAWTTTSLELVRDRRTPPDSDEYDARLAFAALFLP